MVERTAMVDPLTQLEHFRNAVLLLGGQRETARQLGSNERTIRSLCSGERSLHDGWLHDISCALLDRAELLRELERHLSPSFASNLTDEQALGPRRGGRLISRNTPAS
jgi:hypothetical protein